MVPLASQLLWQKTAQAKIARILSFVTANAKGHLGFTAIAQHDSALLRVDCYPSLRLGLDPSGVRPTFCMKCPKIGQDMKSAFANPAETADSRWGIILQRGSSSCTKLWRLSPFFQRLSLQVALASRSTPTAQHLAQSVARPLALPPKTTSHKVPSLAAFWVLLLAIKVIAGKLGIVAARCDGLIAKATRAFVRVAFSFAIAPQTECPFGEGC